MNDFSTRILIIVGVLGLIEALWILTLLRRIHDLRHRVKIASEAALDSARAAAIAAPGGIDPEVVISLLRSGHPVTLDAVTALSEQLEETEELN